tara:strand:+ start:1673 stop:1858 length:186 start_codon:yes stop_codon:yes gene_type:complete
MPRRMREAGMSYGGGGSYNSKSKKPKGMSYMYGGSHMGNPDPRMEAARFKGSSSMKRRRGM